MNNGVYTIHEWYVFEHGLRQAHVPIRHLLPRLCSGLWFDERRWKQQPH